MEYLSPSRRRSSSRNVPSGEKREESAVFTGYKNRYSEIINSSLFFYNADLDSYFIPAWGRLGFSFFPSVYSYSDNQKSSSSRGKRLVSASKKIHCKLIIHSFLLLFVPFREQGWVLERQVESKFLSYYHLSSAINRTIQ